MRIREFRDVWRKVVRFWGAKKQIQGQSTREIALPPYNKKLERLFFRVPLS